jgi:hypothetical protein
VSALRTNPVRGKQLPFDLDPSLHPDSECVSFFCVAVVSYSSRGSVPVARRPDVGRRAADVPMRVSPGRLARSTRCMAAGQPYLYLIYIVDQIACDFRPLACEFFTRAYMRRRMILLIEVRSMINFFSFVEVRSFTCLRGDNGFVRMSAGFSRVEI